MKKNKKLSFAVALAVLVISVFSAHTYMESKSPYDSEYGISTPESEDMGGMIINESRTPLDSDPSQTTEQNPYLQQIVDLVNEERAKAGVAPLAMVPELNQAAGVRAEEIYTKFAHERPDGSRYRTILDQLGISYSGCGENVAYGFRTPEAVMEGWMNSEGHRANLLNEKYTFIGVGYYKGANGYNYWSQMFTY